MRIGESERQQAREALDRHLADGRLSAEEYGDRSVAVMVATTEEDLAPVFVDLPGLPEPVVQQRVPVYVLAGVGVTAMIVATTTGLYPVYLVAGPVIYALMKWRRHSG
ncbi:DUF1707 SHOCT-like domain-containing protein [Kutzneria albida]|uniref:Putative membrane protein n=1 Tax=Kutzneria albida DSM 43870 TaxID=1449976 RepID=W5W8M6_9PSEU|nr:DUF1707 domain-containing protein [Kutzneria albida]AHH94574.1 putative membrane protein [Kutzneria albida DSM 43870]